MERVALITGANRGLGLETARQLRQLGYRVILTSREAAKGRDVAHRMGVVFQHLEVTNPASIEAAFRFVSDQFGRLDVLVNNAAILLDERQSIVSISPDLLHTTLETNSLAPLWLARTFLPLMFAHHYGRIVNVSSGMGQVGDLNDYAPAYRLSKLMLNGITRLLADALHGKNVLVNAVCPGWVRTDMGGKNAPRALEQGARGIVWAATLPDGGPHGGFFRDGEALEW